MDNPVEQLLHRVNNLLGTIQMQVLAASAVGTHDACRRALELIAESATRTQEEVARFRRGGGAAAVTRPAAP